MKPEQADYLGADRATAPEGGKPISDPEWTALLEAEAAADRAAALSEGFRGGSGVLCRHSAPVGFSGHLCDCKGLCKGLAYDSMR